MNSGIALLTRYFPSLTSIQIERFEKLPALYGEWNEKINVISRKDIGHLFERHILHSLAIARLAQFAKGTKILDAGTGGGFPGIPLAIFFPDVQFVLVDSIGKKIRVVNEIASALELKNVIAFQSRVEDVDQKFQFAVSRAVAPLGEMIKWLSPLVQKGDDSSLPDGMLFLKGGNLEEEIKQGGKKVQTYNLKDFFSEDFFSEKKLLYVRS